MLADLALPHTRAVAVLPRAVHGLGRVPGVPPRVAVPRGGERCWWVLACCWGLVSLLLAIHSLPVLPAARVLLQHVWLRVLVLAEVVQELLDPLAQVYASTVQPLLLLVSRVLSPVLLTRLSAVLAPVTSFASSLVSLLRLMADAVAELPGVSLLLQAWAGLGKVLESLGANRVLQVVKAVVRLCNNPAKLVRRVKMWRRNAAHVSALCCCCRERRKRRDRKVASPLPLPVQRQAALHTEIKRERSSERRGGGTREGRRRRRRKHGAAAK